MDLKNVAAHIDTVPGGTGVMFAIAAIQANFKKTSLIGKIGRGVDCDGKPDIAGAYIIDTLKQLGIDVYVSLDSNNPTGRTMITFFPGGKRLLVANSGANDSFSTPDISKGLEEIVDQSDILFISGYSLLKSERAQAIISLMERAKRGKSLVALDVVPHSVYRILNWATFRKLTRHVDIVILETGTAKRLLPSRNVGKDCPNDSYEVGSHLLKYYPAVLLQPDADHQCLIDRRGHIETDWNSNYASPEATRGRSDILTARLLHRHFERLRESTSRRTAAYK